MEIWLSDWKSCGNSISFPRCTDLTALTAVVLVLCNAHTTEMLCSAAEADLLCWLLSSAAREMHTCTLAGYVITG